MAAFVDRVTVHVAAGNGGHGVSGDAADQSCKEQRGDDDTDELKKNLREDFRAV